MADTITKERIHGAIERITFHSSETGFGVFRVKVRGQRDLVTVIGSAALANAGEYIECYGEWINDRQYGQQFKAESIKLIPPNTIEGIEKYLGSGLIKGIGPHYAKRLVNAFGPDVFEVIEKYPKKLHQVEGLGKKRIEGILQAWADQKIIRNIMVFLQSHGVGTSRAVRIYKTYGDQAVEIVKENPYRLARDIRGIGFKTADQIAQNMGVAKDSLIRAAAGLLHNLQQICDDGHCAYPEEDLIISTAKLLEIDEHIIHQALKLELADKNLIQEDINNIAHIFLSYIYHAELGLSEKINKIKEGAIPWGSIDLTKSLKWVQEKTKLSLSDSQQDAVKAALINKITIITGGPGVGKTTIVNSILKILSAKKLRIALAAPTGRAAKRMQETTGLEAKTIHRLLELDPNSFTFRYSDKNPLPIDLLVVDEASMIDIQLAAKLFKAVPDLAAVLIVGDVDQLPSVGPGSVLQDLINSEQIKTVKLTEIFRQAKTSKIITSAHAINAGKMPTHNVPDSDFYTIFVDDKSEIVPRILQLVSKRIPNKFDIDAIKDIQVLVPMNRGGIGVQSLNIELQNVLNQKNINKLKITKFGNDFYVGDKVMQMVNNYNKDVFNGDIGYIVNIDLEEKLVCIKFDNNIIEYDINELDEIALAYACSIHKSQGSEYPIVIIPLAMQHYMLLARNLLYTAVTRGKKLVIIVGEKKALTMAVKNADSKCRITNLVFQLQL